MFANRAFYYSSANFNICSCSCFAFVYKRLQFPYEFYNFWNVLQKEIETREVIINCHINLDTSETYDTCETCELNKIWKIAVVKVTKINKPYHLCDK